MARPVTYHNLCGPDRSFTIVLHTPGGLMLRLDPGVFRNINLSDMRKDTARQIANETGCRVTVEELVQTSVSPDYTN